MTWALGRRTKTLALGWLGCHCLCSLCPWTGFKLAFNYLKDKRFVEAIEVCHHVSHCKPLGYIRGGVEGWCCGLVLVQRWTPPA